jgi:lactate dehydrogenase-like 2-hydroxyacid dehydrogenase
MAAPIYVARRLTDDAMAALAALGPPLVTGPDRPPTREEVLRDAAGAVAIVCTLTETVDAEVLDAAGPGLRVVANAAVGFDNVDLAAARDRGVVVTNTPGVLDEATADLAFGLVLALARRIAEGDRLVRSGLPWVWGPVMLTGLDLSAGATLGIIGYGRIGRAVARRARGFGMSLLATPTRSALADADRAGVDSSGARSCWSAATSSRCTAR